MNRLSGYRMVLPEGWHRLPTDPIALRPAARRLLLDLWSELPRDETVERRRRLEQELVRLGDSAADQGGRELLLSLMQVGEIPLAASAVVSLVPTGLEGEPGLQELALVSAEGALSSEVAELGRNRGVVVVRDTALDPQERPDFLPATGSGAVRSRQVDVHLPVPDEPVMLLLSFSTPLMALADGLTELFVAIASTVQWQGPQGWS